MTNLESERLAWRNRSPAGGGPMDVASDHCWEGFTTEPRSRRPQLALVHYRPPPTGHQSPIDSCRFSCLREAGPSKSTLHSVMPVWPWIKWKLRPCRRYQPTKSFLQEANRSVGPACPSASGSFSRRKRSASRLLRLVQQEPTPVPRAFPQLPSPYEDLEPPSLPPVYRRRPSSTASAPHLLAVPPTPHRSQTRIRKGNWPRSLFWEAVLDYDQSIRLFTESANAGDAEAARYLGTCIFAEGRSKDNAKAFNGLLLPERGIP